MFHKAVDLQYKDGTLLELTFQNGEVKQYDMAMLFGKYPQLEKLKERSLFLSGKLMGYGIIWNDELDISAETIFEDGVTVRTIELPANQCAGKALSSARADSGISQKELALASGIDQSDISKIERGVANPSISTLDRLAKAMGKKLTINIQ